MKNEYKREKLKKQLTKTLKREQTRNYIILYVVTVVILLVLILYSLAQKIFSFEDLIENIINNIIGILPPLLLFDFFHEKLSRDASALEISNKIAETLMSNPETMELFTEEQKKNFIQSAIESIVKNEDAAEMLNDNLKNYMLSDTNYRVRTIFDYDFELHEKLPTVYDVFKKKDDYFYVQEKLLYQVKFLSREASNMNSTEVKLGFVFDNKELDNVLREKKKDPDVDKCIFSESLNLNEEDVEYFKKLSATKEELICQFQKMFKLNVQIDSVKGVITDILVKKSGLIVKLMVDYDVKKMEHDVRIVFHMPKRWDSLLEVALVDPTRAPKISVSYPEDVMQVEMFSFLSKGEETSLETAHEHMNGIYDISINKDWIYPISGLIFAVKKRNDI